MNKKGFATLAVVLAVIVILVIAGGIWYYKTQQTQLVDNGSNTQGNSTLTFSANPNSGVAPLSVQFTESAPNGVEFGNTVNFGDGSAGRILFAPVCSSCNGLGIVSHVYATAGTYTATLLGSSGAIINSTIITVSTVMGAQTKPNPIVAGEMYVNTTYGSLFPYLSTSSIPNAATAPHGYGLTLPAGWLLPSSTDPDPHFESSQGDCYGNEVPNCAGFELVEGTYDSRTTSTSGGVLVPHLISGATVMRGDAPDEARGWKYEYSIFFNSSTRKFWALTDSSTAFEAIIPTLQLH